MKEKKKEFTDRYRQEPDERAIADFKKLNEARLQKMFEASENGDGQTIKMSFNIPIEYVTLAAWLSLRCEQYQGRSWTKLPIELSDVVEDPLNNHDIRCAGKWISQIIDEQMMFDAYHELCTGYHQYLFKRPKKDPGLRIDKDEDLPF